MVSACIPAAAQAQVAAQMVQFKSTIAVRTAEIDTEITALMGKHPKIQQLVILGSGLDARAWRCGL
jgi:O-methyltransferase involved in polyketide biosynthesis